MEELESGLREEGIECQLSRQLDGRGILGCLRKIDDSDVVYVVNPEGYVGRSVSIDIGYAFAKNKLIYAMHRVDDPPIMDSLSGVLSPKALIDLLKKGS